MTVPQVLGPRPSSPVTTTKPRPQHLYKTLLCIAGWIFSAVIICTTTVNRANTATESFEISIYIVNPISNKKILPYSAASSFPLLRNQKNKISVKACRGEFEPASFVIRSATNLPGVSIVSSDLKGPAGEIIYQESIDIRIVKCWYQGGSGSVVRGPTTMTPELLLKDDSLVKIDGWKKKNFLKVREGGKDEYIDITKPNLGFHKGNEIYDADKLLPFDIPAETNKQIWLTVYVPPDQKAGIYTGSIDVKVNSQLWGFLKLELEVLPFKLEDPAIEHAIYYRGMIGSESETISDGLKSKHQYRKELENILAHGIQAATVYDGQDTLREALELRKALGFRTDKALLVGTGTGIPKTQSERNALTRRVASHVTEASRIGYDSTYFYGKEECQGEEILKLRETWESVHRGGGKVFTAVYIDAVKYVGDLLDLANIADVVNEYLAERWHAHGKLVYSYSNPQAGVEDSEIYRRNYGLKLWCAGYDGAMHYAYQHQFGPNLWNDFDHSTYRDHVFAYPTTDGVIDTIQWEGLREGIDDLRYAATLLKVSGGDSEKVRNEVRDRLSRDPDLDNVRGWMIQQIMQRMR